MLGNADAVGYPVGVAARSRTRRRGWGLAARPWLYLAPAFLVYALFWLGPAAYSLYLSFFDWDMVSPDKTFVYLDNYRRVLGDPVFRVSLVNTVVYVVATVVLGRCSAGRKRSNRSPRRAWATSRSGRAPCSGRS